LLAGGVEVVTTGDRERFDNLVLSTHADVSLRLLDAPTADELRLLRAWRYHANDVTLHRDPDVMHDDRRVWASWNVVTRQGRSAVSYDLNRVQKLATEKDYWLPRRRRPIGPRRRWLPRTFALVTGTHNRPATGHTSRGGRRAVSRLSTALRQLLQLLQLYSVDDDHCWIRVTDAWFR
jgi:hypothetical protein